MDECTRNIYFNKNISETCIVKKIPNQNYAIEITYNSFHFTIKDPVTINIICENGTNSIFTLNKTTLVEITNECYLAQNTDTKTYAKNNLQHKLTPYICVDTPYNLLKTKRMEENNIFLINKYEMQFNDMYSNINLLSKKSRKPLKKVEAYPWYYRVALIVLPVLSSIISTYCMYRFCCKC